MNVYPLEPSELDDDDDDDDDDDEDDDEEINVDHRMYNKKKIIWLNVQNLNKVERKTLDLINFVWILFSELTPRSNPPMP